MYFYCYVYAGPGGRAVGMLVLLIHITRLASNEIVSPSNKIHREVGRAKDLSAPLYQDTFIIVYH